MRTCEAFVDSTNKDAPVRGYLHQPADSAADCLFSRIAPGQIASLRCSSHWQRHSALRVSPCFAAISLSPVPAAGPPPRGAAERDQQDCAPLSAAMRKLNPGRVFLGGHSYGGRQASLLAASEPNLADALLLLSYPLHPPKQPGQLRTAHFPSLQVPALFVHGVRDGFGTIAEMESALSLIPARTELAAHRRRGARADDQEQPRRSPRAGHVEIIRIHASNCLMTATAQSRSKSAKAVDRQLARYREMRDFHITAEPHGNGSARRRQGPDAFCGAEALRAAASL